MVHYHALFADLLGEPADREPRIKIQTGGRRRDTSQQYTASDPEEMAK